jgi:hypothetical protein
MRLRSVPPCVEGTTNHPIPMPQILPNSTKTVGFRSRCVGLISRLPAWLRRRRRTALLVGDAATLADPLRDREHVGLWASFRLAPSSRATDLALAAERFAGRSSRDPALAESVDRAAERMLELDRGHAERHFLQISGYRLEDLPPPCVPVAASDVRPSRRRADRAAKAHRIRPGMLATLLVLFVVAITSRSADPLAPSLARLSETQPVLFGSLGETVRGHRDPSADAASLALVQALDHIEASRTSLLGFHTGYDRGVLIHASSALDRALETHLPSEPLVSAVEQLKVRIDELIDVP